MSSCKCKVMQSHAYFLKQILNERIHLLTCSSFLYLHPFQENTDQKKLRTWTLLTEWSAATILYSFATTWCWVDWTPQPAKKNFTVFFVLIFAAWIFWYGAPFRKKVLTFMHTNFSFYTASKYFSCDIKLL